MTHFGGFSPILCLVSTSRLMTNDTGVVRNLGGHGRGLAGTVRTVQRGQGGRTLWKDCLIHRVTQSKWTFLMGSRRRLPLGRGGEA